jgi:hypothetical protein
MLVVRLEMLEVVGWVDSTAETMAK